MLWLQTKVPISNPVHKEIETADMFLRNESDRPPASMFNSSEPGRGRCRFKGIYLLFLFLLSTFFGNWYF
jgi:hypothetical protein